MTTQKTFDEIFEKRECGHGQYPFEVKKINDFIFLAHQKRLIPKLLIVGYGRAGKDTCAEYISKISPLRYGGSTSNIICPLIAKELGVSEEEAWNTRHLNRQFWYEWANEYRKDDPAKLIKTALEKADMVVGIRDKLEMEAVKDHKLIDLIIWIDNARVRIDSTVTFNRSDCDVVICNHESLQEFHSKIKALVNSMGLTKDDRSA